MHTLTSPAKNKFADKSFKGIFIVYAFDSLAWLIYNLMTQRVTRNRSVVFDEEWKSTTTTLPSTITEDDQQQPNTNNEDTPIPEEQQPTADDTCEQEPVIPTPGGAATINTYSGGASTSDRSAPMKR